MPDVAKCSSCGRALNLYEGVNPYAARPGVDIEDEGLGETLRLALTELFESDICDTPDEIVRLFNVLLTDRAIDYGWIRNVDGVWFRRAPTAGQHSKGGAK